MSALSQAPWSVEVDDNDVARIVARDRENWVALLTAPYTEEARLRRNADAALIAAAPELLEAAKAALREFQSIDSDDYDNICVGLEAAIAKAEGA